MKAKVAVIICFLWVLECCPFLIAQEDHWGIPKMQFRTTTLVLDNWLLLGPFSIGDAREAKDDTFLVDIGAEKEQFLGGAVNKCFESDNSEIVARISQRAKMAQGECLDLQSLYNRSFTHSDPTAVYAVCGIESLEDSCLELLVGAADATRIWLNDQLVFSDTTRHGLYKYSNSIPITLNRGLNICVFKVSRWKLAWGLTAMIVKGKELAADVSLGSQGMLDALLLQECILNGKESIILEPRGVPFGARVRAKISSGDTILLEKDVVIPASIDLPSTRGLRAVHRLTVSTLGASYSQHFISSSLSEVVATLERKLDQLPLEVLHRHSIQSCLKLLTHLLLQPEISRHSRTIVYLVNQIERNIEESQASGRNRKMPPGLHLRAFQSDIDGSIQHYRVYIPKISTESGAATRLAVVVPTSISASKPFLVSPFMLAHSEAERLSFIAEKFNTGLVWCGYRSMPSGAPADFAHMNEVLKDLEKFVSINNAEISLIGSCSGGALATMASVAMPQRFAAIGLLNPIFAMNKNCSKEIVNASISHECFRYWYNKNNVVQEFLSQRALPVLIVHDGAEPGHGELRESERFVELAKKYGANVLLKQEIQASAQHFTAWERILEWISKQRVLSVGGKKKLSASRGEVDGIVGSISSIMSSKFMIVEGVSGSEQETKWNRLIADKIAESWRRTHYVTCRRIDDTQITSSQMLECNLIIVGNNRSNRVWRILRERVRNDVNYDQLIRLDMGWGNVADSVICAYISPFRPDRRIVFLGADDLSKFPLRQLSLSTDGWYTKAIWKREGDRDEMKYAIVQ